MTSQLSLFTPQFDFSGKIRKVDIDGQSFVSVFDVLEKYSTDSNPRRAYAEAIKLLEAQGAEVVRDGYNLRMHKFPGAGQRPTPIGSVQFFMRLIGVIEVSEWEHIRVWMNDIVVDYIEGEKPKVEPPRNRKEQRYLDRQIVYGRKDRSAALMQLQQRRDTTTTYKDLMATVSRVVNNPNYAQIADEEYVALFGYTTKQLRALLDTSSVRDAFTDTQLSALQFLEKALRDKLTQLHDISNYQAIQELQRMAIKIRAILDDINPTFAAAPALKSGH